VPGRPFTANRAVVAPGTEGSTASPYTVSVGMATTSPATRAVAAASRAVSDTPPGAGSDAP